MALGSNTFHRRDSNDIFSDICLFLAFVAHNLSMVESTNLSPGLMRGNTSACISNTRNLAEVTVNQKEDSEEEAFFRALRDIQGLDIIISLQFVDCYTLPYRSIFRTINFSDILTTLAKRQTTFKEVIQGRKFKESFGFYGYEILKMILHSSKFCCIDTF